LQRVGLASSRSAQFVHETFADIHYAEDRVVGTAFCDKTRGSYGHGQVVREVILPGNTTFMLLDLAILIEVIHLYAPIYSLFENHSSTSFPIPSLRSPGPTASTMMMTNIWTMSFINDLPTVLCPPACICLGCVGHGTEFWLVKRYWLLCCPNFWSGVPKKWLRYVSSSCMIITVY
jgi:hypothetical protein